MVNRVSRVKSQRTLMLRFLIILSVCASIAHEAMAGDWLRVASRVPDNVDALVIVERASELGDGAAGVTLTNLLTAIVPPATTMDAWRALAGELRLPPDQAFDALLGNRVIFIARQGQNGDYEWAFESEVDAGVARKLLERLGAKPQAIQHNKAIAIIENGRFQITSERRGECATLLFSPTHSGALFGDLLARMSNRGLPSLAAVQGFTEASKAAPMDAHAFLFLRHFEAPDEWMGLAASVHGDVVKASITATVCEEDLPTTPFSVAQWKALSRGRMVAIVEPLKALDLPISWALGRLGEGRLEALSLPIDGRIAITIDEAANGGLALSVALETPDVDRLAAVGDSVVAGVAGQIAAANRTGVSTETFSTLGGLFPEAARTIELTARDAEGRPQRSPLGAEDFLLTWSYQTTRACPDRCGWWIIAGDRGTHDATARALTAPPRWDPGTEEPVSYLQVRPIRLERALRNAGLLTKETETLSRVLSLIESIDGHTVFAEGLLRGELKLKLGDAATR